MPAAISPAFMENGRFLQAVVRVIALVFFAGYRPA
jgi:hypothetical protein